MPTYDYLCRNCGFRFEKFQSIVAAPVTVCPECQEEAVERLVSGGAGLIFKGSGFYITDYAKKNTSGSSNGSSNSSASSATNGTKKSSSEGSKPQDTSKTKSES